MKTQNVINAIEDLRSLIGERYPIPKEWVDKTSFFHRTERINFLVLTAMEKIEKKIESLEREINARD